MAEHIVLSPHPMLEDIAPSDNLDVHGFSSEFGGEVAAAWLAFVESCKLQKKAALEVFNGYFQRITEEILC